MFRSTGYHVPAAAPHPSSPSPTSPPPSPLPPSLPDFPLPPPSPPQPHPCHTTSTRATPARAALSASFPSPLPPMQPPPPSRRAVARTPHRGHRSHRLQRGCGACSRACERAWCARAYVRALVCVSSCGSVCAVFRVLADPLPSRRALLLVCPPAVSAANARAALLLLWAVSHIPGGRASPRDPSDAIIV